MNNCRHHQKIEYRQLDSLFMIEVNSELIGPFNLHGENNIFQNKAADKQGVYLITIAYREGYLISYVGETKITFKERMKNYLIQMLGGNYRILDAKKAEKGKVEVIWWGLWRKGTKDNINLFIDNYIDLAPKIIEYIKLKKIFLLPMEIDRRFQRLIEGKIASDIKSQEPPISLFLPKDIRYFYKRKKDEKPIHFNIINIDSMPKIYGLKSSYKI